MIVGFSDEDTDKNLKTIYETVEKIKQDRFPFLEHPGRIHFLYKVDEDDEDNKKKIRKGIKIVSEESRSFDRSLILLERMVLDHLQIFYRDALNKAVVNEWDKKD